MDKNKCDYENADCVFYRAGYSLDGIQNACWCGFKPDDAVLSIHPECDKLPKTTKVLSEIADKVYCKDCKNRSICVDLECYCQPVIYAFFNSEPLDREVIIDFEEQYGIHSKVQKVRT